jgi:hypothetical protein
MVIAFNYKFKAEEGLKAVYKGVVVNSKTSLKRLLALSNRP